MLLLLACANPPKGDGSPVPGVPDLVVSPSTIDFGDVEVGDLLAAPLTITNPGDGDLEIEGLAIEGDDAFRVAPDTFSLPAGTQYDLSVSFVPEGPGAASGTLTVDTNAGAAAVALLGNGLAPVIEISPTSDDFGEVGVGCDVTRSVTVRNVGNASVEVEEIAYDEEEFSVEADLPWTLAPGEEQALTARYEPVDAGADLARLTVTSSDPLRPTLYAEHSGSGALGETITQTFDLRDRALDVIVVVDGSENMVDLRPAVAINLQALVDGLAAGARDWRFALVVADDGCVAGDDPWLDAGTADPHAAIDVMYAAEAGYYTEMGFTVLEAALAATDAGSCNEGLVRDDADLVLVGVTNEVEQSPNPWSYYVSLFQGVKSDRDALVMYGVGGDYPSGCADAEPASGWYEAGVVTGGALFSICATDWGTSLADALATVERSDCLELSDWPVEGTIVVTVDGVETEDGVYNPTDNCVDVGPEPEGVYEVTYATYGECE